MKRSPMKTTRGREPLISILEVRFGTESDFGFHKPFRFFDLPSIRSESPTTGFGMGSVGVASTEKTFRITSA